eukprot:tig00020553_g10767.t1
MRCVNRSWSCCPAIFAGRRRCLLLVDIQNDFCEGGALAVPNASEILEIVNRLRKKGWHLIVLSQDWHPPKHASFASTHDRKPFEQMELETGPQVLWPDHCVQGSFGAQFHPALERAESDRIVQKGTNIKVDSYSAFYDNARLQATELAPLLKEKGITDVYMCGLATDYCVSFSALDSAGEGFSTFLIEDASRGIDPACIEKQLEACRAKGVKIIKSSDVPDL